MTTLSSFAFDILSPTSDVNIDNNPWQCDCRMVDFKLKITESSPFENRITCSQPDNLSGLKLKDIKLENLFLGCLEPKIVRFERSGNVKLLQGANILEQVVCEATGIPTPTITVIPPAGLNTTAESNGIVTVEENSNVIIQNITAADAGLYGCIASSPIGSTFAVLSTEVANPVSLPRFTLPVFAGSVSGAVAGTIAIGAIILAILCRVRAKTRFVALSTESDVDLTTVTQL
ncbi:hypothetical protein Bbelb_377200 [Branchiostoma belcheri]|nr:hypothetical protein Bbelb_441930 [Branchiostoma belcheri]KAI8484449.1 hypothetical protein Bbelb_377200 [Branchiostoma belcheri]